MQEGMVRMKTTGGENRWTMRVVLVAVLTFGLLNLSGHSTHHHDSLAAKRIEFVENLGQWEENVLFKVQLNSGVMFAEANALTYVVLNPEQLSDFYRVKQNPELKPNGLIDAAAYRVHFVGANSCRVKGYDATSSYNNYYLGNDSRKWKSKVGKFRSIVYENVYEGVDLTFFQNENHLKYEFSIQPFASPQNIRMEYEGADKLLLQNGNLIVQTSASQIVEMRPVAYQITEKGETTFVECRYQLDKKTVSYNLGAYDESLPLIIDPVLIFSSYSGSTADNWGYTATYDKNGNLYSGGNVFSIGYPTTVGAYQVNYGGASCDIAISKFDATGNFLYFSTYLGGNATDIPHSLVVNDNDELYVLGSTASTNYPTTVGAYDATFHGGSYYLLTNILAYLNGSDIVISKFNGAGTALLGSTYFGGSGNDGLNTASALKKNYADEVRGEIIIDENSNVYVVSSSQSKDLPTTAGAFSPSFNGGMQDGCVIKLNHNLTNLIWCSYLGGIGNDAAYSIVMASDNSLYVCGGTTSPNLAVSNGCVQSAFAGGAADGFIAHIAPNGDALPHCTYLGKSGYDQTYLIKNDRYDHPHVFGQTDAAGLVWVDNAQWYVANGGQFMTKLTPTLDSVIWSTAFGRGNPGIDISPTALLVDLCNNIYMSGWGSPNTNFGLGGTAGLPITADAYQNTTDNNDYYFICISDDASQLVYATYFGSPNAKEHVDGGTSRFDNKGRIYQAVCAGCGGYDDFPTTPGAWSEDNGSTNCNIGVIKFDFNLPAVIADFNVPNTVCAPIDLTMNNVSQSVSQNTGFYWDFGDGSTSTQETPTHHYDKSGVYTIQLVVQDYGSCNFSDTAVRKIVVLGNSTTVLSEETVCSGSFVQIGIPPSGENLSYLWTPSVDLNNATISNPIASPSVTTTYYLYVSNGVCMDTLSQTVLVENLSVVLPDTVKTCAGTPVVLTPSFNGTPSHCFWYDSKSCVTPINKDDTQSSLTVSPSVSTIYYLKASNDYCEAWDSVLVEIVPFSVVAPAPFVACYGDTTSIYVKVSPKGNYSYQWSPTSTIVGSAQVPSPKVEAFQGMTYNVLVTNEYGCKKTAQVEVKIKKLSSSFTLSPVSCYGKSDGEISIFPAGGTPPYHYQWSNGATEATVSNVSAGTYGVIIEDAIGCKTLDTFSVTQPLPLEIYSLDIEMVECDQICDGLLKVYGTGGTGQMHYHWLHGDNDSVAENLCAGVYTVEVVDDNGCQTSKHFPVFDDSFNGVDVAMDSVTCPHSCDGSIFLDLDFGDDGYSVLWDDGRTTDTLQNLCPGTYHSRVDVVTGCSYDFYLSLPDVPELNFSNVFIKQPSCWGDMNGNLSFSAQGGFPPYHYFFENVECGNTVDGLSAGKYLLSVKDAHGCSFDTIVELPQPDPLSAKLKVASVPCVEVCNATAEVLVAGGTPSYACEWSNGATESVVEGLCAGDYSVRISDARHCAIEVPVSVQDSSLFPADVTAWCEPDTIYDGEIVRLHTDAWNGFHYHWTPETGVSHPHSANTEAQPSESTCYVVTVTDAFGCKRQDSLAVQVIEVLCYEPYVFIPNAFSPNSDGKNDVLLVRGDFAEKVLLRIYDRWGEMVFETTELTRGWNGTFKGKECEMGVYDYYLEVECAGGKKFFKKGNVTLLR